MSCPVPQRPEARLSSRVSSGRDEGAVILELSVVASGEVGKARILWSQCRRLGQAALTAVQQWRFEQVRVNGDPVPFAVVANVPFRLPARFKRASARSGACDWMAPPKPHY